MKPLSPTRLALAAAMLCALQAQAQSTSAPNAALPAVAVSGHSADAPVQVGGFGDTPVAKLPLQASLIGADRLVDAGVKSLAGITQFDASVSDAYNASGYISYLKVRGFDLDNRFNYRRDGLPINAETALALDNKSSVEVLKGASGMLAGTSSPGGLVNLVVKRPVDHLFDLTLGVSERGTTELSVDWSERLGASKDVGLRVNASAAELRPELYDDKGQRRMLAVAGDWRVQPGTLLEAELEWNHQSQRSQPGFSLLGNTLPDASRIDPRLNLNDLPWSLPVVFDNTQGSLRLQQVITADWSAQAHWGFQRLRTDDRLAYAFGCTAESNFDRYCSDGSFDRYDYRSEGEHRDSDATDLSLNGRLVLAGMQHRLNLGVLQTHFWTAFGHQTYQYSGTGSIYQYVYSPPNPAPNAENTNRIERTTELYLRDQVQIDERWSAWLGLRQTRLHRESVDTAGQGATSYNQTLSTPWLGLSYALSSQQLIYASWGQGMESDVAPNLPDYTNGGQALPAAKSRQTEIGLKSGSKQVDWSVDWFDIVRPQWDNTGLCNGSGGVGGIAPTCTRQLDGQAHHSGVEAQADLKWQGGGVLASAMRLRARVEDSLNPALNGLKPVNVPETQIKLNVRQLIASSLQGTVGVVYEGPRAVLPDNSQQIGGWARVDAGLRYEQNLGRQLTTWRLGVDNLFDRRAWRESPYQYGHVYLYPLAPRTWRASVEVAL